VLRRRSIGRRAVPRAAPRCGRDGSLPKSREGMHRYRRRTRAGDGVEGACRRASPASPMHGPPMPACKARWRVAARRWRGY